MGNFYSLSRPSVGTVIHVDFKPNGKGRLRWEAALFVLSKNYQFFKDAGAEMPDVNSILG